MSPALAEPVASSRCFDSRALAASNRFGPTGPKEEHAERSALACSLCNACPRTVQGSARLRRVLSRVEARGGFIARRRAGTGPIGVERILHTPEEAARSNGRQADPAVGERIERRNRAGEGAFRRAEWDRLESIHTRMGRTVNVGEEPDVIPCRGSRRRRERPRSQRDGVRRASRFPGSHGRVTPVANE